MEEYVVAAIVTNDERNYRERIRLQHLRDNSNPFELTEVKFKKMFRLPKTAVMYLCEQLNTIEDSGTINKCIKILASLHFYADGSYQAPVGADSLLSLSQPSVSRAINETTNAIVDLLAPSNIKFPTTREEKNKTMQGFQEIRVYGLPNVLGAVDGSHVAIFKPASNHQVSPGIIFFNRKGYYSINCQIVTDANGVILSLNPNFPGSTHDAAIWRSSMLARHLKMEYVRGEQDQYLLGDKGYPLQPWLMTPVVAPETDAERSYNSAHALARNIVELTFGRLKNKLRCLNKHRTLHYEPAKAAKIIIACCTLYNMFQNEFADEDDDDNEEDEQEDEQQNFDLRVEQFNDDDFLTEARAKRESIIQLFR